MYPENFLIDGFKKLNSQPYTLYFNDFVYLHNVFFHNIHFVILRTLPAKHVEKIAEQMRKHNINALLIIGGFEVSFTLSFCLCSFCF